MILRSASIPSRNGPRTVRPSLNEPSSPTAVSSRGSQIGHLETRTIVDRKEMRGEVLASIGNEHRWKTKRHPVDSSRRNSRFMERLAIRVRLIDTETTETRSPVRKGRVFLRGTRSPRRTLIPEILMAARSSRSNFNKLAPPPCSRSLCPLPRN